MTTNKTMHGNREEITLVWLAQKIEEDEEYDQLSKDLQSVNCYVVSFTDISSCIKYLQGVTDENLILLIPSDVSGKFISTVSSVPAVISIFLYSKQNMFDEIIPNQHSKSVSICKDKKDLIQSIRLRIHRARKQFVDVVILPDKNENLVRNVTHDPASLLWLHILLEIMQYLPESDEAKSQMLETCKTVYRNNSAVLAQIELFENSYKASDAIVWYTKDSFLYRLVNKALRTDDVYLLYLLRFYITDLWKQLREESKCFFISSSSISRVYRGQMIKADDFEKLQTNCGHLVSPNGFLSTSRDINVALCYVGQDSAQWKKILFEIAIDPTSSSSALLGICDIAKYSCFPSEEEVLFNIGTVFKLQSMDYDHEYNIWRAHLSLSDERVDYFKEHIQMIGRDLLETNPRRLFGKLLIDMGQLSKAERYYNSNIESLSPSHNDCPSLYHGLGYINYLRGQYAAAIEYDTKGYQQRKATLPAEHLDVARSALNLGCDHVQNGDYAVAMALLHEALDIRRKNYGGDDHSNVAIVLAAIGNNYIYLDDYQAASHYLFKALDIFQRTLPSKHAKIASTYMKIGFLFEKQLVDDQALLYYHRAHETAEEIMPSDHPSLKKYFHRIINKYKQLGLTQTARDFALKKLNSQKHALPENHPNIIEIQSILQDLSDKV